MSRSPADNPMIPDRDVPVTTEVELKVVDMISMSDLPDFVEKQNVHTYMDECEDKLEEMLHDEFTGRETEESNIEVNVEVDL